MDFGNVDGDVVEVLLSGGETAMADVLVNGLGLDALLELVGDEGVAEIVDFGVFDAGFFEVAVDGGADVSDEERAAGFGDEDVVGVGLGTDGDVVLQSGGGRTVEEDGTVGVVF